MRPSDRRAPSARERARSRVDLERRATLWRMAKRLTPTLHWIEDRPQTDVIEAACRDYTRALLAYHALTRYSRDLLVAYKRVARAGGRLKEALAEAADLVGVPLLDAPVVPAPDSDASHALH